MLTLRPQQQPPQQPPPAPQQQHHSNPMFESGSLPPSSPPPPAPGPFQGLSALFLALKRRPVIRYQRGADIAAKLSESLYRLTYKQVGRGGAGWLVSCSCG